MKKIYILLFLIGSFVGCKTTQEITKTDVNEKALNHKAFEKVCVLALMHDTGMKEKVEKRMVKALKKHDMNVVASADIAPNKLKSLRGVSVQVLDSILNDSGCDALFTVSLLDTKSESKYIHNDETIGTTAKFSYVYYGDYRSYYSYRNSAEHQAASVLEQTSYIIESVMYDVKSSQYVWSVQSDALQPVSIKSWVRGYAKLIEEKISEIKTN
ncbi:MAG: hypothetical protein ACK5JS_06220 [Mangrovibacterium sp.]